MATGSKAPMWQRVASGILALGIIWAFAIRVTNGELDTWLRVGSMLVALYGGYLFGHFAVRGRLPVALGAKPRSSSQGTGGSGAA